jgi:CRP-like cAMP-binding protein
MFAVLSQRVIERLARDLVSTTARAGTAVVVEGHSGDAFYVIESGQVKVTQGSGRVLRVLGPGDWFGELALLRDIPRTSTCTALTDVTLQRLGRNSFLNALTGSRLATHAADEYARRRYHDLNGEPG